MTKKAFVYVKSGWYMNNLTAILELKTGFYIWTSSSLFSEARDEVYSNDDH